MEVFMLQEDPRAQTASAVDVLSKAALRAATRLHINQREFADIVGISPAAASRAFKEGRLPNSDKAIELTTLFVRVFRSLDAIVGGEEEVAAAWLRNPNNALGKPPLEAMKTIPGLVATLAYLDARRALV
jgi:hypothetical protein